MNDSTARRPFRLAIALLVIGGLIVAVFGIRNAVDRVLSGTCGGSGDVAAFSSLEENWPVADYIALVQVEENPAHRTVSDEYGGGTTYEDTRVSVAEYLKGDGSPTLTIREAVRRRTTSGCEYDIDNSLHFRNGHSYVMFLTEGRLGRWIPFGSPGAFEVDEGFLRAVGSSMSPEVWRLSTLEELRARARELAANPPTPFP